MSRSPEPRTDALPALVILAHGSRDARWRRPFEGLREALAARRGAPVELAYLQFCEPTLDQALGRCAEANAGQVLVVPAFMSGGGHLLRDVPETVAAAAAAHPGLQVRCSGALAEEPEVMDAMVEACLRLAQP